MRVLILFEPLLRLFIGFPVESSPEVRLPYRRKDKPQFNSVHTTARKLYFLQGFYIALHN